MIQDPSEEPTPFENKEDNGSSNYHTRLKENRTGSVALARFLSYLLHPLVMPSLCMVILFQINTYLSLIFTAQAKIMIYLIIFFNTFLIPLFVSLFLLRRGKIRSLHMDTTTERKIPLLATAFCYTFTYYILKKIPLSPVIYVALMGAIIALIIQTLVNLRWKISAHMTGIGGLTGAVFGIAFAQQQNLTLLICTLFVVSGILGAARLMVSDHTPSQIYWGFLNGFLCQVALFALL